MTTTKVDRDQDGTRHKQCNTSSEGVPNFGTGTKTFNWCLLFVVIHHSVNKCTTSKDKRKHSGNVNWKETIEERNNLA